MPNENGNDNEGGQDQNTQNPGETPRWEDVLAGLPEEQQALYTDHVGGLRTALQSERDQRQDLARQMREATSQLEEGSQVRTQLETLGRQLEEANRRADFVEEAVRPEIGCTNPRLAYLAAQESEAIDRRGRVNWEALRGQYPELFRTNRTPPGHAGTGAGGQTPGSQSNMDDFIRREAGVRT